MLRVVAEPVIDRRQRRRQETIDEILDIAVDLMAQDGVAGLSLGEVARSLGIRPPSLYSYFPSKNALYDALFARAANDVLQSVVAWQAPAGASAYDVLLSRAQNYTRWCVEHPVYAQLLFWRPVPGFEPSADAYQPAVQLIDRSDDAFAAMQGQGLLRRDANVAEMRRDWTILLAGVVSQQLANAPQETFAKGRFTAALPNLVAMFLARYGSPRKGHRS